ncbi:MAG TPA: hypothetical protein VF795_11635 [Desulfuromonadaceae bacterium]
MNMERAAMRGKLAELTERRIRLRHRITGQADALRARLNTALFPPDELDVPVMDEQFDTLKAAWTELAVVNADIERLQKELE